MKYYSHDMFKKNIHILVFPLVVDLSRNTNCHDPIYIVAVYCTLISMSSLYLLQLGLLANTVNSAPQILLDSLPKVREAFDYLAFLPPTSAEGLLKAVQPLMKLNVSLKDSLMLVLRKAMFARLVVFA